MTEYVVAAELTAWESKSIIWFCSKQSSVFFFFFPSLKWLSIYLHCN